MNLFNDADRQGHYGASVVPYLLCLLVVYLLVGNWLIAIPGAVCLYVALSATVGVWYARFMEKRGDSMDSAIIRLSNWLQRR
jgi:hypothetical protein